LNFIFTFLAVVFLIGCDNSSTEYIDRNVTVYVDRNITIERNITVYEDREVIIYTEPLECSVIDFDATFKGRIVYEDKTPYKRGAVKAEGSGWVNFSVTDDNGSFEIGVKGDDRFIFSASSPFGDFKFYSYITPLLVQSYSDDGAYECNYDEDTLTCYDKELIK